jgi:hypothetical protein
VNLTVALDPGQRVDPAALVVVERLVTARPDGEPLGRQGERWDVVYARHWALGTPHTEVIADAEELMSRPETGRARFLYDETGVGAAYRDLFRLAKLGGRFDRWPVGVTITAGAGELGSHVSKRLLVGRYEAKLASGQIAIRDVPLRDEIARQHERFRAQISRSGQDTYAAAREGRDHDDLLLALMIATHFRHAMAEPRYVARDGQVYASLGVSPDPY